jgi:hypothetical protein
MSKLFEIVDTGHEWKEPVTVVRYDKENDWSQQTKMRAHALCDA